MTPYKGIKIFEVSSVIDWWAASDIETAAKDYRDYLTDTIGLTEEEIDEDDYYGKLYELTDVEADVLTVFDDTLMEHNGFVHRTFSEMLKISVDRQLQNSQPLSFLFASTEY